MEVVLKTGIDLCTKTLIFKTDRNLRCDYVTQHCQDKWLFLNYFDLYYCTFDQNWVLISLVCIITLFLQIRLLEYTSGGFISEAISKVAGYLKLTEAMAGATLLAFSNGATDVITALVAGSRNEGDELAIGALFGASTFAITIILASVIWAVPGNLINDLKRGNLVRDIITYLIATSVFLIFAFKETNYAIIGIILIMIYFIYVFIVWLEERKKVSTIGNS
jgi:sodium/potassium/calcium exchanger 6